jgi:GAF domain/PilZ domain/Sel1 repeat
MAALSSVVHPATPNRRRRVRHKIQTPAYATFTGESKNAMLDLYEILNISEAGVAIQCPAPMQVGRRVNLCLDLAECPDHIYTTGQVVWSKSNGCAGLKFAELPPISLFRLREWLFLNVVAAVANADYVAPGAYAPTQQVSSRPSYSEKLAAVTAIQREVEALGSDLTAALELLAMRTQSLLHASGAAIALPDEEPDFMICNGSAGMDSPPVGARLQVGSGFSGECVRSGRLIRCNDSETDPRVDTEGCRAMGIRSILAVPVRVGDKCVAIVEAFSPKPSAFDDGDDRVGQRLAETVLAAINRAARAENLPPLEAALKTRYAATPGSVLFASETIEDDEPKVEEFHFHGGISLPRLHLLLLISAAAVIALVLGYQSAPLIQNRLLDRDRPDLQTVLASTHPPAASAANLGSSTVEQLRQLAESGDRAAQNSLGLLYLQGDDKNGVRQNEAQAIRWFRKAAEQGNVAAQSKLGALYWAGRGVNVNYNEAYFWSVLARAAGDKASQDRAMVLSSHLTRDQAAAIEQQADLWVQRHQLTVAAKPRAAH